MRTNKSILIAAIVLAAAQSVIADEATKIETPEQAQLNRAVVDSVDLLIHAGKIKIENGKLILKDKSILEQLKIEGSLQDLKADGGTICV